MKTELRAIQLGNDVRLESTWHVSFIDVFVCLCLVLNVPRSSKEPSTDSGLD